MVIISNDDPTFISWRENNPTGFILVTNSVPSEKYLSLHKADYHMVNGNPKNGTYWTVNLAKVCSLERTEIEQWAERSFGSEVKECGTCFKK